MHINEIYQEGVVFDWFGHLIYCHCWYFGAIYLYILGMCFLDIYLTTTLLLHTQLT